MVIGKTLECSIPMDIPFERCLVLLYELLHEKEKSTVLFTENTIIEDALTRRRILLKETSVEAKLYNGITLLVF